MAASMDCMKDEEMLAKSSDILTITYSNGACLIWNASGKIFLSLKMTLTHHEPNTVCQNYYFIK